MIRQNLTASYLINIAFFVILFTIGISNLLLVHGVPGFVFLAVSLIYLPVTNNWMRNRFGFGIPIAFKIILGLILIWFTLGVSDLGDMID